jgi:hypothetical protein
VKVQRGTKQTQASREAIGRSVGQRAERRHIDPEEKRRYYVGLRRTIDKRLAELDGEPPLTGAR